MIDSTRLPLTSLGLAAAALLAGSSAWAQGGDDADTFDRTPRQCIATSRIRNTDILDDRTIIW
jgi:hypothetical protein